MERIGLAPGTEVGGYRVIGPVGEGGMGAVYRVRGADGEVVALKLIHQHLVGGPARERLAREVAALQRVRHPGVARVLDAETDSADAFVVTELVDGPDLVTHVADHGPMGAAELADLAERLREALVAVHDAGVLHRDLTPGNVLISADGPVLIDFGIAQSTDDARVTTVGHVAGTPGYLCPEVLGGAMPSREADWWGWAATLAFAATGRPPFGVRPIAAVLARVRTGDPDLDGLDDALADALRSAMRVEPEDRATPETVVAALRAAAGDGPADPVMAAPDTQNPAAAATVVDTSVEAATVVDTSVEAATVVDTPIGGAEPLGADEGDDRAIADEYADEGYDEEYDEPLDLEGPLPPARRGTVLAVGLVLAVAGAGWPGVALLVAVVLAVLVRSVGLDVLASRAREARRGAGRGQTARAVVGWPWYLVRAVLGTVPAAVVAASAIVVIGGVGWWAIGTGRWPIAPLAPGEVSGDLPGTQAWVVRALLVVAVVVGLMVVWFGPMCRTTRVGARFVLATLAPPRVGAVALVLVALAGAAALATLIVLGQSVVWWPLPGAPALG